MTARLLNSVTTMRSVGVRSSTWVVAFSLALAACSDGVQEGISLQFRPITNSRAAAECTATVVNPTRDPTGSLTLVGDGACYTLGPSELSPRNVSSADATKNPPIGSWYLELKLNKSDAAKFAAVTQKYRGEQMGIVIDGKLLSAPTLQSPITDGDFHITGDFTERHVKDIARRLTR